MSTLNNSTSVTIASAFNLAMEQRQQQNQNQYKRHTRSRSKSVISEDSQPSVKESHLILSTQNRQPSESDLSDSYDYQPEDQIVRDLEQRDQQRKKKGQWLADKLPQYSPSDNSITPSSNKENAQTPLGSNNSQSKSFQGPDSVLGKRVRRRSRHLDNDQDQDDEEEDFYQPREEDSGDDHILSDEGKDRSKKWPKSRLQFKTVVDGKSNKRKKSRKSRGSNASDVASEISLDYRESSASNDHKPSESLDDQSVSVQDDYSVDILPPDDNFSAPPPPPPPAPKPTQLPKSLKATEPLRAPAMPPPPLPKAASPKKQPHRRLASPPKSNIPPHKPKKSLLQILALTAYVPVVAAKIFAKNITNHKKSVGVLLLAAALIVVSRSSDASISNYIPSVNLGGSSEPIDVSVKDFQKLSRGTQNLQHMIETLNKDMQQVKTRVKYGEDAHVQMQSIQNKLDDITNTQLTELQVSRIVEKLLPHRLLVRKSPTGEAIIDDAFWKALRSVFETQNTISNPNWDEFIRENSDKLKQWLYSEGGVDEQVVNKLEFMNLVDERVRSFVSNASSKKSGLNSWFRGGGSMPSSEELQNTVSDIVESSLRRYSADTIGKTDYALFTAGARVIPSQTSPTYSITPVSFVRKVLGKMLGSGTRAYGRPPVTALHPDTNVGMCWSFHGSAGEIGVKLARPAVPISGYTIDHASPLLVQDRSSAPQTVELWGISDDQNQIEKIKEINEEVIEEISREYSVNEAAPAGNSALLAVDTYDLNKHHIQTFEVRNIVKEMDFRADAVVLRVNDNHGNKHHTCLYRLRVHSTDDGRSVLDDDNIDQS
ncbi:hypothetical protein E3P91_02033 [Wallemia ichthyophaga]|nr:hypothetical protein E3P91_02033 [Wallemia ichthyophaga]TIB63303.1 hypothetical protein E3P78_01878 [Wallemia ichthyophaga]